MNGIRISNLGGLSAGVAVVLVASLSSAYAAKISNDDSAPQTVVVTEGASKREMIVAPGETVDFCPSGCFVTFPNGDREALTGDENLSISGGKATVK